jgi:multicomponent K+:H+ antiporter subunit D
VSREAFGEDEEEDEDDEIGVAIPATMALLGMSFMACALLIAGLPPLSGFLAKFAILAPLLGSETGVAETTWALLAALVLSGLATIIAMTRTGIEVFWVSPAGELPRVRIVEIAPVMLLLGLCVLLTVYAGPVMRYMDATAQSLHLPQGYTAGVLRGPDDPGVPGGGSR